MAQVSDFAVGDHVIHFGTTKGRVVAIEPTRFGDMGVRVDFEPTPLPNYPDRNWTGHYDQQWFDTHPAGLRKIDKPETT